MKKQPPETLKTLALAIHRGEVFTDRHLRKGDENMLGSIFMAFLLMENAAKFLKGAGMVYEYHSKRGPMSINGYPIFMSVGVLNEEDAASVWKMVASLEAAEKAAVEQL